MSPIQLINFKSLLKLKLVRSDFIHNETCNTITM